MTEKSIENTKRKTLRREDVQQYPFLAPRENDRRMFPTELEDDPHVMYHGTSFANFDSILEKGFLKKSECRRSFGKTSRYGLVHWDTRRLEGEEGVIIAVRFDDLTTPDLDTTNFETAYLADCSAIQPKIIGYMVVPKEYPHHNS